MGCQADPGRDSQLGSLAPHIGRDNPDPNDGAHQPGFNV